jgi:pimeloyl-ACP methyl ester carboxylesterase
MSISTSQATTSRLVVAGAELYFEVRGNGPLVALHAAPMDATSFESLAELLATSYTVLTSDPRGINRSKVDDADRDVTPDERADDLAALIAHVDAGPAHVFGSSGGAVSALALLQRHPALVATVIAHEPPLGALLPDRDELYRRTAAMVRTYLEGDRLAAWREFLDMADIAMAPEMFEAVFGATPEGQQAADERFAFAHMELPTTFWAPDLGTLRTVSPALVVAIGEDSAGQLCDRAARALAAAIGIAPTMFPGGHIGFVEDPVAVATHVRTTLGARRH